MFGISILHRTVLAELLKVFVMSLLGITGILVLGGIVPEATQQGLNPLQILGIIPLLIPSMMPYSIPATTLFTACVVYGRLSADNEILAIKAAGINVLKVLWPGVLLGALMSATTGALYYHIIPTTQHLLKTFVVSDVEELLYGVLRKDREFNQPKLNYVIAVRQVQGRRLIDAVFFKRKDAQSEYDVIARAREAELRVDMDARVIHVAMRQFIGLTEGGQAVAHVTGEKVWTVALPDSDMQRPRRSREHTWEQLLARREEVAGELDKKIQEITDAKTKTPPGVLEQLKAKHIKDLEYHQLALEGEARALAAEMWMRPVLAAGCLCFVLVGCPVGIWFGKSDYLSAFITCFLPIVFTYYPLLLAGTNLAKDGKVHPAAGLWVANAALGLIGLVLFRRVVRN